MFFNTFVQMLKLMAQTLVGKTVFVLLAFAGLSLPSFSQIFVQKVDATTTLASTDGFFYSLPRTCLRVDIKITQTEKFKGPYAEYAEKFLGLSQVTLANNQEFAVESISMSSFQEPDPDEYYFVQSTGRAKDRRVLQVFFAQSGVIGSFSALTNSGGNNLEKVISSPEKIDSELVNQNMYERVDTITKKISVDTATYEQKLLRKIATTKTPEQKAREAADFVLKLDESMYNLISGYQEVNYEKGTIEFMHRQMENLKNDYLELFKGYSRKTSQMLSFIVIPVDDQGDFSSTFGRFSIQSGFSTNEKAPGDAITIKVKGVGTTSALAGPVKQLSEASKPFKGIYYRIPEMASVSIELGRRVLMENRVPINQFGQVTYLPAGIINNLELFNTTGGLKHVILQ